MLSECIDEVVGVVGGEEFDAKVVYIKSESGGKSIMCPKARSILHRGVAMRLDVFYKAFVGDDSGFLDPIHPLSNFDVDLAARVSDIEEGLFNNHLVGNVPEIDLHVLEVVHLVIEVVVDDVCGHLAGPSSGVGDDVVEMDIEVQ